MSARRRTDPHYPGPAGLESAWQGPNWRSGDQEVERSGRAFHRGNADVSTDGASELEVPRLLPPAVGDQLAARLLTELDRRAAG